MAAPAPEAAVTWDKIKKDKIVYQLLTCIILQEKRSLQKNI